MRQGKYVILLYALILYGMPGAIVAGETAVNKLDDAVAGSSLQGGSAATEYDEAVRLCAEQRYAEAIEIFNRLGTNKRDIRHTFAFIDALIEQSWMMKTSNNQNWEPMARRAQAELKRHYRQEMTNPDYWILYAKFAAIDRNTHDMRGGFKKALYYKPDYLKALLEQGRLYHRVAVLFDDADVFQRVGGGDRSEKKDIGRVAKKAYQAALKSPDITRKQTAAVYYNLGELERDIFRNKKKAAKHWEQSVKADADGEWAMLSQERLNARE